LDGRFSCDFRHPVCPLQAFGIFLAASYWTLKPKHANGRGQPQ
jgi:hypothetical protein